MLDRLPAPWRVDRQVLEDRGRWSAAFVTPDEAGLLLVAEGRRGPTLVGRGDPAGVVALVARAVGDGLLDGRPVGWMSVPRGVPVPGPLTGALGLVPFSTWDWMATATPPPAPPGDVDVEPLDPHAEASAIRDCLAEANPGTSADPERQGEAGWWGVRSGGRLLGVVGASRRGGDPAGSDASWHLHGLGVRPQGRGRGVGAALTVAATAAGLASGADWVSLGMYEDNSTARRLYERLGFATEGRYASFGPATADRPPR